MGNDISGAKMNVSINSNFGSKVKNAVQSNNPDFQLTAGTKRDFFAGRFGVVKSKDEDVYEEAMEFFDLIDTSGNGTLEQTEIDAFYGNETNFIDALENYNTKATSAEGVTASSLINAKSLNDEAKAIEYLEANGYNLSEYDSHPSEKGSELFFSKKTSSGMSYLKVMVRDGQYFIAETINNSQGTTRNIKEVDSLEPKGTDNSSGVTTAGKTKATTSTGGDYGVSQFNTASLTFDSEEEAQTAYEKDHPNWSSHVNDEYTYNVSSNLMTDGTAEANVRITKNGNKYGYEFKDVKSALCAFKGQHPNAVSKGCTTSGNNSIYTIQDGNTTYEVTISPTSNGGYSYSYKIK